MASITFSGQLDQAMNEAAAEGNKILFIPQQTVGEVLPGAASELIVESDGSYSITLAYNTYSIYHYSDVTKRRTKIADGVVVSADTEVSTIPDLIGSTVPVTEDSVLTIQGYLTDAQESAAAAATSETNAAASAADVNARVVVYEVESTEYLIDTFDGSDLSTGDIVRTLGYSSAGDGYGAEWIKTSDTDTVSQSPSDLGLASLTDINGAKFDLVGLASVGKLGIPDDKYRAVTLSTMIDNEVEFSKPDTITTLNEVAARWSAGEKYPICFYGDSTTDGRVSTTDGTTLATVFNYNNLSGGEVPDGLDYDHDESDVPYCYVSVMQNLAREFYDNDVLRIYNAGYRAQELQNGWAARNVYNAIYANTSYSDVKMIGIHFGINDSNTQDDKQTLVQNTVNYTKALILDAMSRGVQPFLVTSNAYTSTGDNGGDHGENTETIEIIEQCKKSLAKEFNLELVDNGKGLYDFIYKNNYAYTTIELIADDIHGGDIIHCKQAEYMFSKYLSSGLVVNVTDGVMIDAMHPASKFPSLDNWFSTDSYGAAFPRRFFSVTSGFVSDNDLDGESYYDLWVWCEDNDMHLTYEGVVSTTSTPSSASYLPELSVESNLMTSDVNQVSIYDDSLPGFACGSAYADYFGTYSVGRLRYGLNRIRVSFPTGFESDFDNWSTGFDIGYFSFNKKQQDSARAVSFRNQPSSFSFTYPKVECLNAPVVLKSSDSYAFTVSGTDVNVAFPSIRLNKSNFYSLNKVGDYVDITFTHDVDSNHAGYLLSSQYSEQSLTSVFDVNYDIDISSSLVLYNDGTYIKLTRMGSSFTDSLTLSTLLSEVTGKTITIRLSLESISNITLYILDEDGVSLESTTLSATLSRQLLSGLVGGAWINRGQNTDVTVNLKSMTLTLGQR